MPAVDRSFYANEAHGHRYWDYVSEELPDVVARLPPGLAGPRRDLRRRPVDGRVRRPQARFTHPERYAAVASLSGVADITQLGRRLERAEIVDRVFDGRFGPEDDLFELLGHVDPASAPRL